MHKARIIQTINTTVNKIVMNFFSQAIQVILKLCQNVFLMNKKTNKKNEVQEKLHQLLFEAFLAIFRK